MIRFEVHAMGMLVDVLEWDGNIEELRAFGPDSLLGVDEGVAQIGCMHSIGWRKLRPGDILVRPAGRTDISPLHLYQDAWWARELGLVND